MLNALDLALLKSRHIELWVDYHKSASAALIESFVKNYVDAPILLATNQETVNRIAMGAARVADAMLDAYKRTWEEEG